MIQNKLIHVNYLNLGCSISILLFQTSAVYAGSVNRCKELFSTSHKIHIGSEFHQGDAAEKNNYFSPAKLPNTQTGDIKISINAEQSETPDVRLPSKGGTIGSPWIDPKRSDKIPNFFKRVNTKEYQNSLQPNVSLLTELNAKLPFLLENFLRDYTQSHPQSPYLEFLFQISKSLHSSPSKLEFREGNDPIFATLPQDRIAATLIGKPGAPIIFNQDLMTWGEFQTLDLKKIHFSGSFMANELNVQTAPASLLTALEYHAKDTDFARSTNINGLISWLGILLHERAHQIGMKDSEPITPDHLAAEFQTYLTKQIVEFQVETETKTHPWLKVIQFLPHPQGWKGDFIVIDLNGARSIQKDIIQWLKQAYPELNAQQSWFENVRIQTSSKWDVFSYSMPFILRGDLMIEKLTKNATTEATEVGVVKRDAELILFFGAENTIANSNFNNSKWAIEGNKPEQTFGPQQESLVQLRLFSPGTSPQHNPNLIMKTPWPKLKLKPTEPWQLLLETDHLPQNLIPLSGSTRFNVRPSNLRNNVWLREGEEPIQITGRWENIGSKTFLHGEFKPKVPLLPGTYFITSVIGQFKNSDTNKVVTLEIPTTDRISIEVQPSTTATPTATNSSLTTLQPLELKRFGTVIVKEVDRTDQIRWMPLNVGFDLTWTDHTTPIRIPKRIAGWIPVPFVFNRPVNPKRIWLHGTAHVKDATGKDLSFLFSGPLEELSNIAKLSRVYQNSTNETVMELKLHQPMRVNNFEFVKWYFQGMTVVEENFAVSYQRLQFYFGRHGEKQK